MKSRPKYVKPETVNRGDLIRVTWETGDASRSIQGVVAEREYQGSSRVLTTADGHELLRYIPGITASTKVMMIKRSDAVALFEIGKI